MNMQRLAEKIEREYPGSTARVTKCGAGVEVWDNSDLDVEPTYLGVFTRFSIAADALVEYANKCAVWEE